MDGRGFVVACSLADRTSPRRCIEESCLGSVEVGPATFANREADASLCLLAPVVEGEKEGRLATRAKTGQTTSTRAAPATSTPTNNDDGNDDERRYSREREGTD